MISIVLVATVGMFMIVAGAHRHDPIFMMLGAIIWILAVVALIPPGAFQL